MTWRVLPCILAEKSGNKWTLRDLTGLPVPAHNLRVGSEKDVQPIFDTFYELNFYVDCYIDKTAKELKTCIRRVQEKLIKQIYVLF